MSFSRGPSRYSSDGQSADQLKATQDSLRETVRLAQTLSGSIAADVLAATHRAFTTGLDVVAGVGGAIFVAQVIVTTRGSARR